MVMVICAQKKRNAGFLLENVTFLTQNFLLVFFYEFALADV